MSQHPTSKSRLAAARCNIKFMEDAHKFESGKTRVSCGDRQLGWRAFTPHTPVTGLRMLSAGGLGSREQNQSLQGVRTCWHLASESKLPNCFLCCGVRLIHWRQLPLNPGRVLSGGFAELQGGRGNRKEANILVFSYLL